MKRTILTAILTGCAHLVFSQITFKGHSFGAGINQTHVLVTKKSDAILTVIDVAPRLGLSLNYLVHFNHKKNEINSGLRVNVLNFRQKIEGVRWGSDVVNGVYFPSVTYSDLRIFSADLLFNYALTLHKNNALILGLAPTFRVKKEGSMYTRRTANNEKTEIGAVNFFPFRQVNLFLNIGFRHYFNINSISQFVVEPNINFTFLKDAFDLVYEPSHVLQLGVNVSWIKIRQ